jgi:hypothetical protein
MCTACLLLHTTTILLFVRTQGVDGYVAGGMTADSSSSKIDYNCAAATSRQRMHLPLLMQWTQPKHPVLRCVLLAYDDEKSPLNK